jgi:large subunit ribosomal protein L10
LAISKDKKSAMMAEYQELVKKSQAIIITKYGGMNMPQLDKVRKGIREAQGEFHVTKNTLLFKVLKDAGYDVPESWLTGQAGVNFCFSDPPVAAKKVGELAKEFENFKVVGGVMSGKAMDSASVESLASLPSLDTLRAQIIGLLSSPASNIVGAINSAVGGVMLALQAKIDKETPAEA